MNYTHEHCCTICGWSGKLSETQYINRFGINVCPRCLDINHSELRYGICNECKYIEMIKPISNCILCGGELVITDVPMKKLYRSKRYNLPILYLTGFPHGGENKYDYGTSIYKGIVIQWDEDYDERIIDLLDSFEQKYIDNILIIGGSEGSFSITYKDFNGFVLDGEVITPDGDHWTVYVDYSLADQGILEMGYKYNHEDSACQ